MAYKLAVLVALAAAATLSVDFTSSQNVFGFPYVTHLLQENNNSYLSTRAYEPDISKVWNHSISRICSTGIWIFYDHIDYNTWYPGNYRWNYGIDSCFDTEDRFAVRSFRYAGSPTSFDEESFTFYQEIGFAGADFLGTEDYSDIEFNVKYLGIAGASPWTFFNETNYAGDGNCFEPSTLATKGNRTLHGNLWGNPWGVDGKVIRSAKKGCHSNTTQRSQPLPASHQAANAATGSFGLPKQ